MNDLTVIETLNPVAVYSGGLDEVLNKIKSEVASLAVDISTEKGRKEIASIAYKIARSKTALDDAGKKLGEDAKLKLDAINADRKKCRDFLDKLKDDFRKPLTDWENYNIERIAEHEEILRNYKEKSLNVSSDYLTVSLDYMRDLVSDITHDKRDYEEFTARFIDAKERIVKIVSSAIELREKHDKEQAELAEFRRLQAEREQQEREALIAAKATQAAEEKARLDAIEASKIAQAKIDEAKKAELLAIENAEKQRLASEEKARMAVLAEQKRIADLNAKDEAELIAREKDKENKKRVHNDILNALQQICSDEETAKNIIKAIALGNVPHVKINY
jgi:hypothetical protein